MKLVKKITKKKVVEPKTGKEVDKTFCNFFIQADNGDLISIRPVTFKLADGSTYSSYDKLSVLAERIGD